MSCMTDIELRSEFENAQKGEAGYLSSLEALTRFFDSCEYRNVYVISYSSVQRSFDELTGGPKRYKRSEKSAEPTYRKCEISRRYLPCLVKLIKAILKWAEDEELHEYDITNELIDPVIRLIKEKYSQKARIKQICFETFFKSQEPDKENLIFDGEFFKYLSAATPDYDELLDAAAMTERSKKAAEDEYRNGLSKIPRTRLMLCSKNQFEEVAKRIEIESGLLKTCCGVGWSVLQDFDYLDRVPMMLRFKTVYSYNEYYEEWDPEAAECEHAASNGVPAHNSLLFSVPEREFQGLLNETLKEHIIIGADIAQKMMSDSYSIWRSAYLLLLRKDFESCIARVKEAEAVLFADGVIKRYKSKKKIIEYPRRQISSNEDEYQSIHDIAYMSLKETEKALLAIKKNDLSEMTVPVAKRSELLQKPWIGLMVGCFESRFVELITMADEPDGHQSIRKSMQENMCEVKLLWKDFLHSLLRISGDLSGESLVMKSISALKDFFDVFEYNNLSSSEILEVDIELEKRGQQFISSLENLSPLIEMLKEKSFEDLEKENGISPVLVGGFTEGGKKQLKSAVRKPRKNKHSEFRTQEQVAKDTGFSRKTINKWEREQTSDDTNNKSNKYEYYESLRTDPEKNGAYKIWVKIVVEYKKKKGRKKSFVSFKEEWWEHNRDAITMLHLK